MDDPASGYLRHVLGMGSIRLQVLRELVLAGEAGAGDLTAALGLSRSGLRKHLRELELAGLVTSTVERRSPTRSVRVWTASPSRISDFIDDVDLYLLGSPGERFPDHVSASTPT